MCMQDEKRQTVSISVKPSIWKKAKIYSATNDLQLSEFIENLIEEKTKKV